MTLRTVDRGLDRGELLTRWRAVVFADPLLATILNNLAGDQLQRSDIRLIPLPPPGDHPPPEITLLADLTSAPLILLLTQSPADQIAQLGDHDAPDRPPPASLTPEARSAAVILDLATQLELHIEILPLTISHPLDLLHPDAIRRCISTRADTPVFPGHDHAHHLHTTANGQPPIPYPEFLHATYAITSDPATVQTVAQTMRRHHLPLDPQLTDALWQIERIALNAETR
jgi:hypothetical protein